MKTVTENRRDNMQRLADEAGSAKKLSEKLGKSASQVSQWINGSKDSKTGKPRGMSDAAAREVEEKCGKNRGWLDQEHAPQVLIAEPMGTYIPTGNVDYDVLAEMGAEDFNEEEFLAVLRGVLPKLSDPAKREILKMLSEHF